MQIKSRITRNRKRILLAAILVTFLGLLLVFAIPSSIEPIESRGFALLATRTPGPTPTPYPPLSTLVPLRNITPNRTLTAHPLPTATRLPPDTPLPTVPSVRRAGLWAENLTFGPLASFGQDLRDPFRVIEWSPDGNQIAASLFTGDWIRDKSGKPVWEFTWIAIIDKMTRSPKLLTRGYDPHWSPDGRRIAYDFYPETFDAAYLRIIDVETRKVTDAATFAKGSTNTVPAWLSTNELAFFKDKPMVFDVRTGQSRPLLDPGLLAQTMQDFPLNYFTSAPTKGVFAIGSGGQILIFEWANGSARLIRRIDEGSDNAYWALSPNASFLAYASQSGRVKIVGVNDASLHVELRADSPLVESWSPDSASLVYRDSDHMNIVNRDGSGLRTISTELKNVRWSPSGNQIIGIGWDTGLIVVPVTQVR